MSLLDAPTSVAWPCLLQSAPWVKGSQIGVLVGRVAFGRYSMLEPIDRTSVVLKAKPLSQAACSTMFGSVKKVPRAISTFCHSLEFKGCWLELVRS